MMCLYAGMLTFTWKQALLPIWPRMEKVRAEASSSDPIVPAEESSQKGSPRSLERFKVLVWLHQLNQNLFLLFVVEESIFLIRFAKLLKDLRSLLACNSHVRVRYIWIFFFNSREAWNMSKNFQYFFPNEISVLPQGLAVALIVTLRLLGSRNRALQGDNDNNWRFLRGAVAIMSDKRGEWLEERHRDLEMLNEMPFLLSLFYFHAQWDAFL